MVEIEKNFPIPEVNKGSNRFRKYPIREMEVGDSILVDGTSATSEGCKGYSSAMTHAWRTGKRFSGRKEGDGKVRIWRVE